MYWLGRLFFCHIVLSSKYAPIFLFFCLLAVWPIWSIPYKAIMLYLRACLWGRFIRSIACRASVTCVPCWSAMSFHISCSTILWLASGHKHQANKHSHQRKTHFIKVFVVVYFKCFSRCQNIITTSQINQCFNNCIFSALQMRILWATLLEWIRNENVKLILTGRRGCVNMNCICISILPDKSSAYPWMKADNDDYIHISLGVNSWIRGFKKSGHMTKQSSMTSNWAITFSGEPPWQAKFL